MEWMKWSDEEQRVEKARSWSHKSHKQKGDFAICVSLCTELALQSLNPQFLQASIFLILY